MTAPCRARRRLLPGLAWMALVAGGAARAEELNVEGRIGSVLARDRDGDGMAELWVSYEVDGRRYLGLFDGKKPYSGQPDRRLPVDAQAILYTLGDFDAAPGLELVFVSRTSGVLFPLAGSGAGAEPRKLFDADLFFAAPDPRHFPAWLSQETLDADGDGAADLAIPERNRIHILFGQTAAGGSRSPPSPQWRGAAVVPVGYHTLHDSREARVSRVVEDFAEEDKTPAALHDSAAGSPFPLFRDFDGDGRLDVIVKQPGQVLEVYRQTDRGVFSAAPDVRVELVWAKKATALELADLNGDRRLDVVGVQLLLKDLATEIRVLIQDPSRPDVGFAEPRQILKVQGFFRRPALADLNGDGRLDLAVSPYRVDLLDGLKKSVVDEVEIAHEVFLGTADSPFERRPSYVEKLRLRTQDVESGSGRVGQSILAGRDVTGDGKPDFLFVDGGRELRLYRCAKTAPLGYEEVAAFRQRVDEPRRVVVLPLDTTPGDEVLIEHRRRLQVIRGGR